MRKTALVLATIALTLFLAACGGGSSATTPSATVTSAVQPTATTVPATTTAATSAATIKMGSGVFSGGANVTIKAGQSVTFDDTKGGPHNLVTGSGGSFTAEPGAPAQFGSSGLLFAGGDSQTVAFMTAGVYHITCSYHPAMQATVTVTA